MRGFGFARQGVVMLAAMVLICSLALSSAAGQPPASQAEEYIEAVEAKKRTVPAEQESSIKSTAQVYAAAKKAVVRVLTDRGFGSGFFVSDRGLLATNLHVIEGAQSINVELEDQSQVRLLVLAVDANCDLAVLKPEKNISVPAVLKGRAEVPAVGEAVLSIGSPMGLSLSLSQGIVSSIRTAAEVDRKNAYRYIQSDVGMFFGNSGGPLVDLEGRVVGVCTFFQGPVGSRLNFAVEWQAVADLLARADPNRPMPTKELTHLSEEKFLAELRAVRQQQGKPSSPAVIAARTRDLEAATYCNRCTGTGMAVVTGQVERQQERTAVVGRRTVVTREKSAAPLHQRIGCPLCGGSGILRKSEQTHDAACRLVEALANPEKLEGTAAQAAITHAQKALEAIAWDDGDFAREVTVLERGKLARPSQHQGEPVVVVGHVQALLDVQDLCIIILRPYGTKVVLCVMCPKQVTALPGDYCLVAGILSGHVKGISRVNSLAIYGVHGNLRKK